ncbi:hypothetical protein [Burkholderia multivorans]|uniref:hypothetical protein n=1 Tax=Burkholderia multivorans TaxID=87883 RepID=UPI0021BEF4D9|nr:hypothetical protein [Burkholderia multivorans]
MLLKIARCADTLRDRVLPRSEDLPIDAAATSVRPVFFFALTVILYGAYMLCMQSAFTLRGEMWAEMATNYFENANSGTLAQRLLSTDAGYIPLPQRIVAIVCTWMKVPAGAIPFAYTWTAVLGSAAMIGVFCLRPFRVLIGSDGLRFLTAIATLIVVDFESRTFINFTYFAAFFAAIVTAVALVDTKRDVPRWAWILPIFMLSKPAVLAALPVMLATACVSAPRFRKIVFAVMLLCCVQGAQILISHEGGTFAATHSVSLAERLIASMKYFIGLLGGYAGGSLLTSVRFSPLWFGTVLAALVLWLTMRRKVASNALLIAGICLLFFNVLLNCFALSDTWNTDMRVLAGVPVYRHIIVGFEGVLLIVSALCDRLLPRSSADIGLIRIPLCALLFACWFVGTGWLDRGTQMTVLPGAPTLNNSGWMSMAGAIDAGGPVCVPVDPIGWVYGRECALLNADKGTLHSYEFEPMANDGSTSVADLPVLRRDEHHVVLALAVLVRPARSQMIYASTRAVITLADGTTRYLSGGRHLPYGGGLVLLTGDGEIALESIRSVRIEVAGATQLGFIADAAPKTPVVLWMGR